MLTLTTPSPSPDLPEYTHLMDSPFAAGTGGSTTADCSGKRCHMYRLYGNGYPHSLP